MLAILLIAAGLLIASVGLLGLLERLRPNRFFGVRTAASLRSAETFRVANKVAGLPALVGGLVGIVAGLAGYLVPATGARIVSVIIGLVGMLAITAGAGTLGNRAALAVPEPTREPCKPCDCGGTCFKKSVGANVAGVGGE